MKVLKLEIKNIKKISDATLELNKPLILIFGAVEQGKTTILDSIKMLFMRGCPDDIIQHGENDAEISLTLENGYIARKFKRENDVCTAGNLVAIINNKKMSYAEISKLINPFQLDQDHLIKLKGIERKRFFLDLFNIDTAKIDKEIASITKTASNLRAEIKGVGNVDLIEVKEPNIKELEEKETAIRGEYNKKVLEIRAENKKKKDKWEEDNESHQKNIRDFNKVVENQHSIHLVMLNELNTLKEINYLKESINIKKAEKTITDFEKEIKKENRLTLLEQPNFKNETDFDKSKLEIILKEIQQAEIQQVKYDNYLEKLTKANEKLSKEAELLDFVEKLRELKKEKLTKLKEVSIIENLNFNEEGDLFFEKSHIDNISTSQAVRLGSSLGNLYPENLLDIELIDRGESLIYAVKTSFNKETMAYLNKLKESNKTAIATIVGTTPKIENADIEIKTVENGEII